MLELILTNISIILLILLLSSFINEHTGVQKIKSKKRKYTIYTVLLIVNFIYFFFDFYFHNLFSPYPWGKPRNANIIIEKNGSIKNKIPNTIYFP